MKCDYCGGPLPAPEDIKWTYAGKQIHDGIGGYQAAAIGVYCSARCQFRATGDRRERDQWGVLKKYS